MLWFVILLPMFALLLLRFSDTCREQHHINYLRQQQPRQPPQFATSMLTEQPEGVQRYFNFSIAAGTPLYRVADIRMQGWFSLGNKQAPNYLRMSARQVLAAPTGFIWQMQAQKGWLRLSGSDSESWTRFWLFGIVPVARFGANADHQRAAFGRYIAEALFWSPAALLPAPGIVWRQLSSTEIEVTVQYQQLCQSAVLTLKENGEPSAVTFQRWSNANPEKIYREQPFGGYLSQFKDFAGFRLPTHVEAGNQFGSNDYFPFFIADITDVYFAAHEP